jgi:hypothetical protein
MKFLPELANHGRNHGDFALIGVPNPVLEFD